MRKIGIIKKIDKLGRLVIPKSYRERAGLGEEVEVVLTQEGVLVRKRKIDEKNAGSDMERDR
jgi:AbrB family looped-hinge helix DNA binding protein